MANSQAMCTSFKKELLLGAHQFGTVTLTSRTSLTAPTTDSFKAALYKTTASLGAGTTSWTTADANEISGAGGAESTNYTAGGVAVTAFVAPATTGTTAYTTPGASIVYTTITSGANFDAVLIYNSSQGNKAVSVHTFGAQGISAGTLTLTMPVNDSSTGLLRLA